MSGIDRTRIPVSTDSVGCFSTNPDTKDFRNPLRPPDAGDLGGRAALLQV